MSILLEGVVMALKPRSRVLLTLAGLATFAAGLLAPVPAKAWWHGGFAVGVVPFPFFVPPVVVGPPVFYGPPPVYYGPPPAAAAQSPAYAQGGASSVQACYAGVYVCPLNRPVAPGASCSCPANDGGRVTGNVH